ncbi:unnamed protein product [Rhizophagus irregularis]|nr:unnamed protein product [Rhizophagus irregularis]
MPVETTHRTLDNKVLPDETSFVIIKKLRFVSGKRRERLVRVGFRRTKTQRFVLSIGWASEERKPKDSFGWASEERKPKDSFGWASEERKPKDSYFLSGGLPKNENPKIRSGGLPKNEDSRSDRLPCSEEREIPRFDRVGFRPSGKEEPRFASGGLPTFGKRGTKIRSGGLPKNDQRFIYTNT